MLIVLQTHTVNVDQDTLETGNSVVPEVFSEYISWIFADENVNYRYGRPGDSNWR